MSRSPRDTRTREEIWRHHCRIPKADLVEGNNLFSPPQLSLCTTASLPRVGRCRSICNWKAQAVTRTSPTTLQSPLTFTVTILVVDNGAAFIGYFQESLPGIAAA